MTNSRPESNGFLSFYDPDFYDMNIGPGVRVAPLYVVSAAERGGPVLELGCGTGDVLLSVARSGIEIWGIDASLRMLERARSKASVEPDAVRQQIHLVEAWMETFDLGQYFEQIFLTNDVVAHLLDSDSLRRTLQRCAAHLSPQGRLVMDISEFDVRALGRFTDPEDSHFRYRGTFPFNSARRVNVWERTYFDSASGVLTMHFRYEDLDASGEIVRAYDRTLLMRPRRLEEVVFALDTCGFDARVQQANKMIAGEHVIVAHRRRNGDA